MPQSMRTYQVMEPKCEIAVAQRPDGLKVMLFTEKETKFEFTLDRQNAFNLAMEILQHAYRLGEAVKP